MLLVFFSPPKKKKKKGNIQVHVKVLLLYSKETGIKEEDSCRDFFWMKLNI